MSRPFRVLLLVDMINCFFPGGELAVPDSHEIVDVVNKLMHDGGYDAIIAVNDSHPVDHVGFADNHPGRQIGDTVFLADGSPQRLWPRHGVTGTLGAEFHPRLDRSKIDRVVLKGVDSGVDCNSGFYNNNRSGETELRSLIEGIAAAAGASKDSIEIDTVGLALNICVAYTLRDGQELGYKMRVVADGSRAFLAPGEQEEDILREMAGTGIEVVSSAEILRDHDRSVSRRSEREVQLGA